MFKVMKYRFLPEGNSVRLSPPDQIDVWEVHRIDTYAIGDHIWAAVIWKVKEKP